MAMSDIAVTKKLVENLQSDLRTLSAECKRKYPPVKEAAESGLLRIRNVTSRSENIIPGLVSASQDIIQPFILGCDTKNPKIVHNCLIAIQRLIQHEAISMPAANNTISVLWALMEAGVEELKLLQTAILLITTSSVVKHESLAKALVLCFRLHFTKDSTTINTAAATIRQLVFVVFERVETEDKSEPKEPLEEIALETLKAGTRVAPKSLRPCAGDAFLLFQDLCQLVNADQPHWLVGMTEMTRTFGLELMESVLVSFPQSFVKHPELSFLLKERVCPLVIKLFSPSLKYRAGMPQSTSPSPIDKPYFPIVMRLLRIVSVLLKHYYVLLVTECEIFLSLLVKFLDPEKSMWQRATALEVLCKLCSQEELLKSFCRSYDMKQHSTKIFQDIVNGLGSFIQSQFIQPQTQQSGSNGPKAPDTQGQPPALVAGMPVGGGVTPQPAFYYRSVWIPLVVNISATQGTQKAIFLEMVDRVDPPLIPDGYGLSCAFLCLLDVVRCVQSVIDASREQPETATGGGDTPTEQPDHEAKKLPETLINSSWCGIMAALALLLEASTDESATEAILKAMQSYANLCGQLTLNVSRDAFITSLCKASLPPHYALTILNTQGSTPSQLQRFPSGGQKSHIPDPTSQDNIHSSQVVAVGTALPTASLPLGAQQGPVMLTAKNIQCMRALLGLAHCHGGILGSSWHQLLTTLQHLVWILGLKPSSGGSLKATQQASDNPNAVITTAVMADLPVLSAMLSRLFESSQYLDDVALHHLIDALCKLSMEAMELAYSNREPSLFAVAKLLETGLVNLPRVEVLWKPVTAHLLEVCQHPHQGMRSWGAEAVTTLIKVALKHKYDAAQDDQPRVLSMLLAPLQELSSIPHHDIRQKQLDCVLQILHSNGETLREGWPLILDVIGAVTSDQGEALVRTAFQSLQLVVTDFLPVIPSSCLQVVAEVAARFGLQKQELNISLTAIGLLWNISDYFYQNRLKIAASLNSRAAGVVSGAMLPFDALWMCIFTKLGELCVDPRPATRKSAGQTLFSTISAHGSLLQHTTWQTVLWKVLFKLLDNVQKMTSEASTHKDQKGSANILIHHSRDTAAKQWAETMVLSLAGVARVFNMKRHILQHLGDFPRAWALLLEFIEASALCQNPEVSLAALKSFQEILHIKPDPRDAKSDELKNMFAGQKANDLNAPSEEKMTRSPSTDSNNQDTADIPETFDKPTEFDEMTLWNNAWKVWLNIGTAVTTPPETSDRALVYIPSQHFLTALMQIFPVLFLHIKHKFVPAELQRLFTVLQRALAVPVHTDSTPFIMPVGEISLTPLQEAVLGAIKVLQAEVLCGAENMPHMYPHLFELLLTFTEYAVRAPKFGKIETKSVTTIKGKQQADWVAMNYVPFAEGVLEIIVDLYKATAKHPAVIHSHVLQNIIKTLRLPLSQKYSCPSQTTWMLSINSLFTVLNTGLPIARKQEAAFSSMWMDLAVTLEEFLFSQNPPPATLSVEDYQRDEAIDCQVITLIRDDILPSAKSMPQEFIVKVMNLLNRGSIHSATSAAFVDTESSRKLREEFAKACFETLLQFSFITQQSSGGGTGGGEEGSITRLAVSSLLRRCQDVLVKYTEDERLSGKCPLPRPRMAEMSFVLKAITTLLVTLKKTETTVDPSIWHQVLDLYPALVDCTTSTSPQVCKSLRDALQEYRDLLAPPGGQRNPANGTL